MLVLTTFIKAKRTAFYVFIMSLLCSRCCSNKDISFRFCATFHNGLSHFVTFFSFGHIEFVHVWHHLTWWHGTAGWLFGVRHNPRWCCRAWRIGRSNFHWKTVNGRCHSDQMSSRQLTSSHFLDVWRLWRDYDIFACHDLPWHSCSYKDGSAYCRFSDASGKLLGSQSQCRSQCQIRTVSIDVNSVSWLSHERVSQNCEVIQCAGQLASFQCYPTLIIHRRGKNIWQGGTERTNAHHQSHIITLSRGVIRCVCVCVCLGV